MKKFLGSIVLVLLILAAITAVRDLVTPGNPMTSSIKGIFLAGREYYEPTAAVVEEVEKDAESPDTVVRRMAIAQEGQKAASPERGKVVVEESATEDKGILVVTINGRELRIPYARYREQIWWAIKLLGKDILSDLGQNLLVSVIMTVLSRLLFSGRKKHPV